VAGARRQRGASRRRGSLDVADRNVEGAQSWDRSREGDRCPVLRVDDDGVGVPKEDHSKVFDRFFRGSNPRGDGSGLGLAVAKELVEADGGSIAILNSDLGGARFEARYPAAPLGRRDLGEAATQRPRV
jgi:signal transduction histidine kinase